MKVQSPLEKRPLKYVATINDEALGEDTAPDFEIRYVDIGNVDSKGNIHQVPTYRFADAPSRARRVVRDGDVIISTVRTYLQAITPIESPSDNLIVSTGFAVIRPRQEILDTGYCKYVLRESEFLYKVFTHSVGVSYPAISSLDLGNILVPIHPLPEQRAIADYLDRETSKIDALVAEKERLLSLLAEKRRTFITQYVMHGLNPNAPMRDSGVAWLGEIPKHWAIEPLKHHLTGIEQGWSPQSDNFPANEDEWGVLKVSAVNGWEFNPGENKRLPFELEPLEEYEIKPGDVLISRANTTELLGSASLVREVRPKLLLCDKLYRLRVQSDRLRSDYLVSYLRSVPGRFEFERDATGASSSMKNISQESITNLRIPIPPWDEQEAIIIHIRIERSQLDSLYTAAEQIIGLLQERRAALISAAVTGQIHVE